MNSAGPQAAAKGSGGKCKKIRVRNRLGEKMGAPGGITREEAIVASTRNVESLRDTFLSAIPVEIDGLELMATQCGPFLSTDDLNAFLVRIRRLLTLAGTFGYASLDCVVKHFCDLCSGMMTQSLSDAAPVHVHIRAMRLLAPGGAASGSDAQGQVVLQELTRIHEFLKIAPLSIPTARTVGEH